MMDRGRNGPQTAKTPSLPATTLANPADKVHRPVAGILFCVTALLLFAIQDSLIIFLSGRYPLLQVLTVRSVIVLFLLTIIGITLYGRRVLIGKQPVPLVARGVLAFLAFTSYYVALMRIPLADAAAVYMTAPLFVTLLSVPLLSEPVGIHRWAAVFLGFTAVIVMLDPGSSVFRFEAVIPLFSALCYSLIPIINRRLGLSEHAMTMAIYTTATYLTLVVILSIIVHTLPAGIIPLEITDGENSTLSRLFQHWFWFSPYDLMLTLLAACVFSVALLCITQAYRIAIVSTVAPFEYSYLLWASLLGFLVFGNVPGLRTIIGGIAVVGCGCYIIYRENRRSAS